MRKTLLDLHEILGEKILMKTLNLRPEKMQKLLEDPNQIPIPSAIEDKMNFLAAIVRNLKGSYNHYGIRQWLQRKRTQLKGKRPIDLLSGNWWPRDQKILKILMLSRALNN